MDILDSRHTDRKRQSHDSKGRIAKKCVIYERQISGIITLAVVSTLMAHAWSCGHCIVLIGAFPKHKDISYISYNHTFMLDFTCERILAN